MCCWLWKRKLWLLWSKGVIPWENSRKSLVMTESERDCDTMKLENVIAAHTKLHYSGSIEQI